MRSFIVAALVFLLVASPGLSQSRTADDVWQARYVVAQRTADDREARLLEQFDADRAAYLSRITEVALARSVSERALVEVTLALGVQFARDGRPADLATILASIEDNAARILDLQERLHILEAGSDPVLAKQLVRASSSIAAGDLDGAEQVLREARRLARTAREGAQLREAEVIGLEANIANLRSDFLAAAKLYAEAAETAPESSPDARWDYRTSQANMLYERGLAFGDPQALRDAVRLYREVVLPLTPRTTASAGWAATKNNLGNALSVLGEGGDDQALQEAIFAYRAALEVRTRSTAPTDWAQTQDNLATALAVLGERGDHQALQDAITAYREVLEIYTREAAPAQWAMTQNNLGTALQTLGEGGDDQALRDGIAAYRAALEVRTRATAPADWAATQYNLGFALGVLGEGGDQQALRDAVAAYRAALETYTPATDPTEWAQTQNNLGNVLSVLGERGDHQALQDAIVAYGETLKIYTLSSAPANWAMTQFNLSLVYRADILSNDANSLAEALAAARSALKGYVQVKDLEGAAEARLLIADLVARK
jgi:Tetratricopeptide repeat